MSRRTKIHFETARDTSGPADLRITLCGRMVGAAFVEVPPAVTCRGCIAALARRPVEEPDPPHEMTSRPAPAPQTWDGRGSDIVARSRAGDDGGDREGWPSLDAALAAWSRARAASPLGSSSRYGGGGGGPKTDHTPGAAKRAERVIEVGSALAIACARGHGFDGGADGNGALFLGPIECGAIVEQYLAGRDDATRIAERLGPHVTEHQVGRVWKRIRASVRCDLESRGLLPQRAEKSDTRDQQEGRMALPNGYDVQGWKQIADELHLSESQARELDRRGELGDAVASYGGTVISNRARLAALNASRVRPRRTG